MPNSSITELTERLASAAAMQRSIGLTGGADLLERAHTTISDLDAALAVERAMHRHPAGNDRTGRVITEQHEALALHPGAVIVNTAGTAFQIKPSTTANAGFIDHQTAAWLLPVTVIHEGASA
ncbi:hypothetical protein ACLBWP_03460 [Microbacterium sp. M1A1_1b]